MKYVSSGGWYSLSFPENWTVEEYEEENKSTITTFCEPENGVGVLQVSAYEIPIKPDFDLVSQFIESLSDLGVLAKREKIDVKNSAEKNLVHYDSILDSKSYFRYWMLNRQNKLLFITYNCDPEDKGKEDEVVNEILNSIQFLL